MIDVDGVRILKVKTLNIQKTNVIEKGVGTLLVESQFKNAIKKHFGGIKFDLITYSTPPITFTNVVKKGSSFCKLLVCSDFGCKQRSDFGNFF